MSTDTRPLAVYTEMVDLDWPAGAALLEENGYRVEYIGSEDPEAIIAGAQGAEALLVEYATITAEIMDALPDLKIISLVNTGFDNCDVDAARERGIWVAALKGVSNEEVATHTLALMLSVVRELPFFQEKAAGGDWYAKPEISIPRLSEQRLGLIGLGRIGTHAATLAQNVFGEVIGYDPYLPDTEEVSQRLAEAGVRRTTLKEVLETSEVVSLHLPLTESTHHLIDADALARMRPGSTLINVSRGQLVDTAALLEAVDSGHLRGAGIDVLDPDEPAPVDHPLLGHPRIQVTPHIAYLSERTLSEYVRIHAQNVVSFRRNGSPDTPLFTPAHREPQRADR